MKVLVIGAGGMIGRKLIERLQLTGSLKEQPILQILACDIVAPDIDSGPIPIHSFAVEFGDVTQVPALVSDRPDVIFHLAAIVSGEAEAEFEKGYRINLDGTRMLLEAIKEVENYTPRLVFASSIAVFGAPFPDVIDDDYHLTPLTSYGTQKAISELLLTDFTRKGHVDGVSIRLPTISVRPGEPNLAASGFFSNIIREPLAGKPAVLPVPDDVMHWMASPRSAIGFCIHAAQIDGGLIGPHRGLSMPGLAITVGEMISALESIAGPEVIVRIKRVPDETIMSIVANWPRNFDAKRAEALGFVSEKTFEEIIQVHIDDELGGQLPAS